LTRLLLSCFGWLVKPNNPDSQAAIDTSISSSNSTMSSQGRPLIEQSGTADADPVTQFSTSSSSSGAADAYAAITGNDPPNSSNSSSSGKADGRNVAELVGSALLRLSDSVTLPQLRLQHKPSQTHVVETLVGVAEVSFRERTRSQALTLNPPQVIRHSLFVSGHRVRDFACMLAVCPHWALHTCWLHRSESTGYMCAEVCVLKLAAVCKLLWAVTSPLPGAWLRGVMTCCCCAEVWVPVQHGSGPAVAAQGRCQPAYDGC
jgi:hypothetical protein